jgi:hypothetical protein
MSSAVALLAIEVGLRAVGFGPWRYQTGDRNEPHVFEPDPELGWRARSGTYEFPPWAPGGASIRFTIWPDGDRATRPGPPPGADERQRLVFVGDSFTQGWAVSDEAAYPWRVQQRRPREVVVNLATGGYGTYQSLLALERYFARGGRAKMVLYGFLTFHDERNIADPRWLKAMTKFARRDMVALPFVTLDSEGALSRRPSTRYPDWPLKERSAIVRMAQDAYALFGVGSHAPRDVVTLRLVEALRDTAAKHGAGFLAVLLGLPEPGVKARAAAFRAAKIPTLDCVVDLPPERLVPGEGHPDAGVHADWADCVGARLERELDPPQEARVIQQPHAPPREREQLKRIVRAAARN